MGYRNWLSDEDWNGSGDMMYRGIPGIRGANILGGFDMPELQAGFNLTGQAIKPSMLTPQFSQSTQRNFFPAASGGNIPMGRFAPPTFGGTASRAVGSFAAGGPVAMGVSLAGDAINYLSSGDERHFAKEQRNNARWAWGKAKSAYGRDVLNPNDVMWATSAATLPKRNALAEGLTRKYGIDAGRVGGYLAEQQLSDLAQEWMDANLENIRLKTQRDTNILGYLGG